MNAIKPFAHLALLLGLGAPGPAPARDWAVFEGKDGPGRGKHIVFLTGDEEYRSEEAGPMLARILAERHGFKCTVLFALNPADGTITPTVLDNLPGLEQLASADLCVVHLRFRELPDAQMKHFVDYVQAGKPLIGLRTATHAFNYLKNKQSPYARYAFNAREWPGGFGQQILGETWVAHHGHHGVESTRGLINPLAKDSPLLRGVVDIWGPTDVYTVTHLPADARVLLWGLVLAGMKPNDPPVTNAKNAPMMPLAWTRELPGPGGRPARVFTTTLGAAVDFQSEDLRRLFVNACYWAVGLEEQIPARANVDFVGDYQPSWFGFGKFTRGIKPADLELK